MLCLLVKKADSLRAAVQKKNWKEAQKFALQLEALDPQNPELKKAKPLIDQALAGLAPAELQNRALRAFYSGDYTQAITLFDLLATQRADSAAAYFYLGCSNAALGLAQGKQGKALLEKAGQQFARVRKINRNFRSEDRFISPRILEIYRQAQSSP